MHKQVEALLLLSQQEERHYLESATKSALESQVTELKQKLAQVTSQLMSAVHAVQYPDMYVFKYISVQVEVYDGISPQYHPS